MPKTICPRIKVTKTPLIPKFNNHLSNKILIKIIVPLVNQNNRPKTSLIPKFKLAYKKQTKMIISKN